MRLECADLMDPRLVCVATIARVVADLLKVKIRINNTKDHPPK